MWLVAQFVLSFAANAPGLGGHRVALPRRATAPVALADGDPPRQYAEVLRLLRSAATSERWPPTSTARARVLHGCGTTGLAGGATFTLANPKTLRKGRPPRANAAFPELAAAVFALEAAVAPKGRRPSTQCAVSCNATYVPHASPQTLDGAPTLLVGLGDYRGGAVAVEGEASTSHSVLYTPLSFDASQRAHWTLPFEGELFTLSWFTPAAAFGPAALELRAAQLAGEADPPIRYRPRSTDANVLCELLGDRSAYAGPPPGDPRWAADLDFSTRGHVVLDVGAQIGVFSRQALDSGAVRVIAVEPEPSNAALCRENLGLDPEDPVAGSLRGAAEGAGPAAVARAPPRVQVLEVALAPGEPRTEELVLGKARSDGVANTWRHALAGSSHYSAQGAETIPVRTRPFFGEAGMLCDDVSFVKLDCEGCELELLRSFSPGDWRGVRRLVFEWSFTKERRMAVFCSVVRRLEAEGFAVHYEGRGQWESLDEWPWKMDAVVFAARR